MRKSLIIKNLEKNKIQIDEVISGLESLDNTKIVFTLFELVDSICNTELDIYKYLRRLK
jgi:hypothetical protein